MGFKERLKEARLLSGLTQEQLANKIGIAKSTVTGYETGNSEPDMKKISKIIDVLKIDANFLWQDEMQIKEELHPLVKIYGDLNTEGQSVLMGVAKSMARNPEYKKYSDSERLG